MVEKALILKKCPFCGGEAELFTKYNSASIRCKECGASTELMKPKTPGPINEVDMAVGSWNSRVDEEPEELFAVKGEMALADLMAHDPQAGDRWTEMLANWTYVIYRYRNFVCWLNAAAPCELPKDGTVYSGTVQDFTKWLSYNSTTPGYWCRPAGREHNVDGWYKQRLIDARKP